MPIYRPWRISYWPITTTVREYFHLRYLVLSHLPVQLYSEGIQNYPVKPYFGSYTERRINAMLFWCVGTEDQPDFTCHMRDRYSSTCDWMITIAGVVPTPRGLNQLPRLAGRSLLLYLFSFNFSDRNKATVGSIV